MEDSEEAQEVSEAPKTSEVKTEVKDAKTEAKEGGMKENSEVATVDEDQRKLFVGGLAQVPISPISFSLLPRSLLS